jgi:excinuclease ABC subunit A
MQVIATSDWIIDVGPDAGDEGGHIIAQGAPEHIARVPESKTTRLSG